MKIAFVGKGGSGKTTLAALFLRHLTASGAADGSIPLVLALDADINQHLPAALGASDDEAVRLPALGDHLGEIKEYLRGINPRISSAAAMVKTTPPGRGSRLLRVGGSNPLYEHLDLEPANVEALSALRAAVDSCPKDWPRYTALAVEFHLRNATAWANDRVGEDLAAQIDPQFVLGPAAAVPVP